MPERNIIAFYSPYPGAGKTLAARWVAQGERPFHRTSFAEPLREAAVNFVNYPWLKTRRFDVPEDKEAVIDSLGVSFRDILVTFGMAGRRMHPDFWIRLMEQNMRERPYDYVIDDLRFPNEYDFLRARGAKIIRIENPGREIVTTSTEGLLEGNRFDAVIANTKENLRAYLRDVEEAARYVLLARGEYST